MTSEVINRVIQGRYRLISQLAVGGMGVTYRAWDIRVGAPVVLKLPRKPTNDPDGSEFARLAARFAREVDVMRALGHDHIVPIVDQGDDDGMPFVTMRFLPGGALSDHRKKSSAGDWQPIPASQLHFWLPSIADALDFMHSRGVLHRDIKPANIFVDGFHNAFLGDFGIAKVVGDESGVEKGQTLTATHLAIGTPEYMAPELLSPKAVADGRADQYALAICVYELLSGRRPFTGSTAHVVIEHATYPVPPLDRELLSLPASLTAAIERALAKQPDQRFESCKAFSRAALTDVSLPPNEAGVARLLCPECRKILRVPLSAGGRNGNCPSCRQSMEIAQDFSALWLTRESTIVAEPATPLWAEPSLSAVDAETTAADATLPVSAFVPVDRPKGLAVTVAGIVASAVIAALLSGLFMHVRWEWHHSRAVQEARAALEQQQATHAAALQDAERERIEAVASVEATWKKTLAESQEASAEGVAAAQARPQQVEKDELGASDKEKNGDFADLIREANESAERTGKADASRLSAADTANELINSVGIALKLMPAGSFAMGERSPTQPGASAQPDAPPVVMLKTPFYIGIYEVTNAQWKRVMGTLPSKWSEDERPVEQVRWTEAQLFCKKLSELHAERSAGRSYRLPTEAEWEYACRAGTTTEYSFGDDVSLLSEYGWANHNSNQQTHPVGQKKPNPWGLYDMHGNVYEWVLDYPVVRGGSFNHGIVPCRSAARWKLPSADSPFYDRGFRVAMIPSVSTSDEAAAPSSPEKKDGTLKLNEDSGVKESSIRFRPEAVRLKAIENSIWLVFGHQDNPVQLVNFEGDRDEAVKVLALVRHYSLNSRVVLTDATTGESFDYWLSDGWAPTGALPSLSTRDLSVRFFDPEDLVVARIGTLKRFSVRNEKNPNSIGHFASRALAEKMLEAVQTHDFNCKCTVGGRNPHFILWMRK